MMNGDVMEAISLANEMDPMMLDRDRCGGETWVNDQTGAPGAADAGAEGVYAYFSTKFVNS